MIFITEILNGFKKCCRWCCPSRSQRQKTNQEDNLEQQFIQLQQITSNHQPSSLRQESRLRSQSLQDTFSLKDQHQFDQEKYASSNMIQSLGPPKNKLSFLFFKKSSNRQQLPNQKPLVIKTVNSNKKISSQRKSSSSSSFHTLKSSASRPISRRNFKIDKQSSSFYAKHRSKDDDFYSINQSESSQNKKKVQSNLEFKFAQNNQNYRDGVNLMNIWIKKQYEPYPYKFYKPIFSQITKMKLQSKDIFDAMVHKLEDYYTFYFQDQHFELPDNLSRSMSKYYESNNHQQNFTYEQKNQQMICSVNRTNSNQEIDCQKSCKFMSLIVIPFCSLPPLAFLQWFNKLEVQSSLHCFNKIEYLQNSQTVDQKILLEYPLVRVEQFNEKLIGKQSYILARQIESVKFQNQEDKQTLLEACFEVFDDQKCFQRLVRVTAEPSQGSRVEIYIQSSENIINRRVSELLKEKRRQDLNKNFYFSYFEERWKKFQGKLNKHQIINKKTFQVFIN